MRRTDRCITEQSKQEAIIKSCFYLSLAMVDAGKPYVVALNFGYANNTIYMHCARQGRKMDILQAAGGKLAVTALFVGTAELIDPGKDACDLGAAYASALVEGILEEVHTQTEREQGMKTILQHVGKEHLPVNKHSFDRTAMLAIRIQNTTAKACLASTLLA